MCVPDRRKVFGETQVIPDGRFYASRMSGELQNAGQTDDLPRWNSAVRVRFDLRQIILSRC